MKKYLLLVTFLCVPLFAQEETIIKSDSVIIGWYGAPVAKFSEINNDQSFLLGGRGGVIINHQVALGLAGYGLISNVKSNENVNDRYYDINFGYGGIEVEYIHMWSEIVHYTASLLIGGGSVSYKDNFLAGDINYLDDQFFIAEPGANIEFNFTNYFRVDIGVSYRFVSKIFFGELTSHHLDGFTTNLTFKFGDF